MEIVRGWVSSQGPSNARGLLIYRLHPGKAVVPQRQPEVYFRREGSVGRGWRGNVLPDGP